MINVIWFFFSSSVTVSASRVQLIWCHLSSPVGPSRGCASPQDGGACRVPGSGSRCRGFHPLESIREAAARWKMATRRQKREGLGLNPATLPYLPPPPPVHSPLSLALLPLLTSQRGLCRATEPAVVQGVRPESQCCKTCHSHFLNAFDQTLPKANVCRQSSSTAAKVIRQTYIYQILLL